MIKKHSEFLTVKELINNIKESIDKGVINENDLVCADNCGGGYGYIAVNQYDDFGRLHRQICIEDGEEIMYDEDENICDDEDDLDTFDLNDEDDENILIM